MKKFLSLTLLTVAIIFTYAPATAQDGSAKLKSYLNDQVNAKKLKDINPLETLITSEHISSTSNVQHIYYRQTLNGIEITGTESGLHITDKGRIISADNRLLPNLASRGLGSRPSSSPTDAIASVAQKMGYGQPSLLSPINVDGKRPNVFLFTDGDISERNIPVKLTYVKKENGELVLSWELSILEKSAENWYNFYVDATSGEIIKKNNWMLSCMETEEHSHDSDGHAVPSKVFGPQNKPAAKTSLMNGTYNVFPMPLESPYAGDRVLVTDVFDLIASPFGWHDTNGIAGAEFTTTRGNNVNAIERGDNFGYQPNGGTGLNFDFPFNPIYSTADQSENAILTNLFYWNNIIHDVLFQYGFDEEGGNFQTKNYSNQAAGNDEVLAQGQDGRGQCNARFGTPADGSSPNMQMYICNSRDGSVDNMVVVHEYGHGISNRLTGGRNDTNCLDNDEQMGEGWSDWYGAMLTIQVGDTGEKRRPVGNWLFGQPETGGGIRAFPYSTDMSIDPRTYNSIKGTSGPHPLGSVWAAMIWEVSWALIDQYGFDEDFYNGTGGNNIAMMLITEGLKLQKCSPGMVDGRDAILAADVALYNGANQCLIWTAFAKRGLGFSADQGSSNNRNDGTQSFDMPTTTLTTPTEAFCVSEGVQTLDSGRIAGGVYSGPGVTDNGDGLTYTFDPAVAGIGTHTITYVSDAPCSISDTATSTIDVRSDAPVVECQDFTVEIGGNNIGIIRPQDVVSNYLPSDNYLIDQTGTFNPTDISTGSTTVNLGDDQISTARPIGFNFEFYGVSYTNLYINSNGFVTFQPGNGGGFFQGGSIPSADFPNNMIALSLNDLDPSSGGTIRYATTGQAPNRVTIIDYNNVPEFGNSSNRQTTQVKLFEGTNVIEIHSTRVVGSEVTQGVENAQGTSAVPVPGRNNQSVNITNDFVSFTPEDEQFPENCGLASTVTLSKDTFNCNDLGSNTITITVTDSSGQTATCTATVTVTDPNGLCSLGIEDNDLKASILIYPNPAKGKFTLKYDTSISVENLTITDITGKIVRSQRISTTSGAETVDVSGISTGLYFVKVNSGNRSATLKLIIE